MISALLERLRTWPGARGAVAALTFKQSPEDFLVDEIPITTPSGDGEFALLRVEKRDANTADVATDLARQAGVGVRDVSWAGRKDRQAVTRQWFSVHLPGRPDPDWSAIGGDRWRIIDAGRHHRKLRVGALKGNGFQVRLRDVAGERAAIDERLALIATEGVPNYFGPQRFGVNGSNLQRALSLDARNRRARGRSMALSAARAFLFNEVLAARVEQGSWNSAAGGDLWMLTGRSAVFGPEDGAEVARRCAAGEIDPTGPLWGRGRVPSAGATAALEAAVAERWPQLADLLERVGLKQERRRLRLHVEALAWKWEDDSTLSLSFSLEAGAFATTVLREIGP